MQIGPKSRLLLATAFSVGLHAAGATLAIKINSLLQKPVPAPAPVEKRPEALLEPKKPAILHPRFSPLVIDPPKTETINQEVLLEQLKTQKQVLIQRTLQSLRKGEHIFLADFLVKSAVLDTNIDRLKSGSVNLIDESNIRKKYDRILLRIKRQTDKFEKPEEKIDEIHHLAHRAALRGYLKRSADVLDVLQEGTYNCVSATAFIAAIEDNLVDSRNYGIVLLDPPKDPAKGKSGHMLSWYREDKALKQIENTDGGKPRRVPFKPGLRAPKSIFMAAYLVKNGVKPSQLPPELVRLYRRGFDSAGFPVAGIATDLPDPGDVFIPNKHYLGDTEEALKSARILRTALSLYRQVDKSAGDLSVSILQIPDDLNWCEIADNYSLMLIEGKPFAEGRNERIGFHSPIFYADYYTAVTSARLLSDSGSKQFDRCLPEKEYLAFESYANNLLEGKETEYNSDKFKKWMADPQKAKELLTRIYQSVKVPTPIRNQAFIMLAIYLPEEVELFRKELIYNNDVGMRAFATFGLRQAKGEKAKQSAKVFYAALERESDPYIKYSIMVGFAILDYGMEIINYIDSRPLTDKEKITLTARMKRLFPDRLPEQAEINKIVNLIEKENNDTVKANLIAILAINGRTDEALNYANKVILPLLLENDFTALKNNKQSVVKAPILEAQQLVLALGRVNSLKIKDMLMAVFAVHPELAPEIADTFIKQGIYSESILHELKSELKKMSDDSQTLDFEGAQPWRITYAALLITLMEELKPS